MSYCNQTPFHPREGWGLGKRLPFSLPLRYSRGPGNEASIKLEHVYSVLRTKAEVLFVTVYAIHVIIERHISTRP